MLYSIIEHFTIVKLKLKASAKLLVVLMSKSNQSYIWSTIPVVYTFLYMCMSPVLII